MPASTGDWRGRLDQGQVGLGLLTKFALKTVGPTAAIGPTWPSMAFTPLIDNWMAPTWEKLAPVPPPP